MEGFHNQLRLKLSVELHMVLLLRENGATRSTTVVYSSEESKRQPPLLAAVLSGQIRRAGALVQRPV